MHLLSGECLDATRWQSGKPRGHYSPKYRTVAAPTEQPHPALGPSSRTIALYAAATKTKTVPGTASRRHTGPLDETAAPDPPRGGKLSGSPLGDSIRRGPVQATSLAAPRAFSPVPYHLPTYSLFPPSRTNLTVLPILCSRPLPLAAQARTAEPAGHPPQQPPRLVTLFSCSSRAVVLLAAPSGSAFAARPLLLPQRLPAAAPAPRARFCRPRCQQLR